MGNITISFTNEGTGVTLNHVFNISDENLLRFVDYLRAKHGTWGGNPPAAPTFTPVNAAIALRKESAAVVQAWRQATIAHETQVATQNVASTITPIDVTEG